MSTPKQIAANRLNSQKSSGPRSAEGKAASRANSLKTGLYARSQVIAGEDPAELRALADSYFLRWEPTTPEESFLVATLVDSEWLLRRYACADAKSWDHKADNEYVLESSHPKGLNFIRCREYFPLLQRRIDSAYRSFHRALRDLERLQTKRRAAPQSTARPVADPPPEAKPNSAQPQSAQQQIGFVPSFSPAPDSASPKPVQAAVPNTDTHLPIAGPCSPAAPCVRIQALSDPVWRNAMLHVRVLRALPAILAVLIWMNSGSLLSAPGSPSVKVWEEKITIPTYLAGDPGPNPMFFFGRASQGAQGPVYPYPMYDTLTGKKVDKTYTVVYLENEYLRIGVLPEIGGRIFEGVDKTNNYNFIYRQHVIKPALIGLIGAWISGGVEWNIPHHHRASTFIPVQ